MPRDHKSSPIIPLAPHNQEVEQGLLGCLLISPKAYDSVQPITRANHFYITAHQRIFEAIAEAAALGQSFSPTSLKNQFETDADLEALGGGAYLFELAGNIVSAFNAQEYAITLKDLWQRRELINGAQEIIAHAHDFSLEKRGVALNEAEKIITGLSDTRQSHLMPSGEAADLAIEWMRGIRDGSIKPFLTGYKYLDDRISGLYSGRLYIIAGRPGMGKSALGINIAENIAESQPTLFVSLEMSAAEISMRQIAGRTGISVQRQAGKSKLSDEEWEDIDAARDSISALGLHIEDSSGIDIGSIISLARAHKRSHGKFVLFIDYLGLIPGDREIKNKVHQIEEITTNLKRIAKELDIPVVLLCQLSRQVEQRDDKRPNLADLRDSGAIEQDADVVIFCFREEYYSEKSPPQKKSGMTDDQYKIKYSSWQADLEELKGKAELIIGKNRQGKTGIVPMKFDGERQRFSE